tara:strand:- start:69 stop:323 length:255 start_codon:yes stop_codon:yes gene_type:complete
MIFPYCDGCGLRLAHHNSEDGKCVACGWDSAWSIEEPEYSSIQEPEYSFKCVKPMVHRPQFEGRKHCKVCKAEHIIKEITGEEE